MEWSIIMLYPRHDKTGKLVDEGQMVGCKEHLSSKHRVLNMYGEIGSEIDSINLLLALDSISHDPIKIIINSSGGLLDYAFLFYDTIKLIESPVITLATWCCSAAVMVMAVGSKRYVMPHSKIMIHLPSTRFQGDAKDLEIAKAEMDKYKNQLVDILIECGAKKTKDDILKDIDREYWMGAQETIDYGLADAIVDKETIQGWLK
jgi:ATP-dependent Clp protease, protease subunit